MNEFIDQLFSEPVWWSYLARIVLFFAVALLVRSVAATSTRKALQVRQARNGRPPRRWRLRDERLETIQRLTASFIAFLAFLVATIASLNLFVSAESLVWMTGLFAGGLGFGLMPLIRDFFTGVTFLFEDPFDVGEKVELLVPTATIEGVVENVDLRTTLLRAPTGELFHIPNGEIRIVRNFSRGLFSSADIVLTIKSADLQIALDCLENSAKEAVLQLPNLVEPWQIVSEDGNIGQTLELKLITKAKYGMAADMRPRLLAFVQRQLKQAGVNLI